jgi:hypothetical protein
LLSGSARSDQKRERDEHGSAHLMHDLIIGSSKPAD